MRNLMASAHIISIPQSHYCCFTRRFRPSLSSLLPRTGSSLGLGFKPFSSFSTPPIKKLSKLQAMETSGTVLSKQMPLGLDAATEEEYASQSKLLREFASISSIEKAWVFKSENGESSRAMFSITQPNLLANKKRQYIFSSHISKETDRSINFQWAPFPIEMSGVSAIVPSPSGLKMLVVRNQEKRSPTQLEIWSNSELQKEIHVPNSVHGSVYTDGWFEGISWNSDETLIAYVAEEPSPSKPAFDFYGYKKEGSGEKDCGSWQGQGDWEEDWGETYVGKRQPALFVVNVLSEEVHAIKGVSKSLSVGQVVWAPSSDGVHQYLVFVGWSSKTPNQNERKLGIKYCYNRPCALYAIRFTHESKVDTSQSKDEVAADSDAVINLTQGISSAYIPRFSPDGNHLVFLSSKSAVDSGAHCATDSLHRIEWPPSGVPDRSAVIIDVVPVVMHAEDGFFPGLYCSNFLSKPWLSDGCTMIISSSWGSTQAILSVNVLSGKVLRISPTDSSSSWSVLALDGDHILAVCSSPIDTPQLKYGFLTEEVNATARGHWLDVTSPIAKCSEKARSLLASLKFSILKIPVSDASENLTKGAKKPYEAIYVSSNSQKAGTCNPLIVILHGGPHSVSLTNFSKSHAFLSALGYNLLIVNYRGSLGFGEEALQSLPGNVGSQDVNDVLRAIDQAIEMGLADSSKIAVLGGSHGGFLTTHLIGQAPNKFLAAAARNPVCNLALMVGTTDIPDWCYMEAYGTEGRTYYTDAPSMEHLHIFHDKSPIAHISKVKTPTLFLLGAQDLRVPVSNGLQYARALKEKGVVTKVIVFPNDVHGIDRPQSDFESFLNIGVWFKKYLR